MAFEEGRKLSHLVYLKKDGYFVCKLCAVNNNLAKARLRRIMKYGVMRRRSNFRRIIFITEDKKVLKRHIKAQHDGYIIGVLMPKHIRDEVAPHFYIRVKR